jgi:hypothetical protein
MLALVSLEIESDSEDIEKEETTRDIEQEIECPRCYDVAEGRCSKINKYPSCCSKINIQQSF